MRMRIRFPELLKERGLTAYAVARDSGGRISLSTIYRLKERDGRLDTFAADMLEALCDVFDVTPGDLLERDDNGAVPSQATGKRATPKRRGRG
jgi:DNA-binding Xre family transcriptional regulator